MSKILTTISAILGALFLTLSGLYGFSIVGINNLEAILALIGLMAGIAHMLVLLDPNSNDTLRKIMNCTVPFFVGWYFIWNLVIMTTVMLRGEQITVTSFTSDYIFSTIGNKNKVNCIDEPFHKGC